jgi:hypothetical protein
VPREVMYFDRVAFFLTVDIVTHIGAAMIKALKSPQFTAAYMTLFEPTAYGWYRRCL